MNVTFAPAVSAEDVPTAVVTGASRGIGNAIARRLARDGFDIVAVARSSDQLEVVGQQVTAFGRRFTAILADLGTSDGIECVISSVASTPRLDVLVNAAGLIVRADPPDMTADSIDATFALNVRAPLLLTQGLLPQLLGSDRAAVVNVTSLAASVVTRASVSYQASKAALVQATRALSVRLGPAVRVNAVGPGYVETDLNRAWLEDASNRGYVERSTALGRVGTVDDVSGVVSFLVSRDAAYLTGQHLIVDGGWHTP